MLERVALFEVIGSDYERNPPTISVVQNWSLFNRIVRQQGSLYNPRGYSSRKILLPMLTGYIFDGLNWCDKNITGGKGYTTTCGCTGKAQMVYAFWKSASNAICGLGIVYRTKFSLFKIVDFSLFFSTLATIELHNLKRPQVRQVTAYIVHDLVEGQYRRECDSESMLELKMEITKRNISYRCEEDPM
ncbi:ADP-ribosyl cyclase 1 [Paragonimus westermani]|uniref:ADP-ribosyl cyclase 1 n=1 Tax=Paragonimus westermani TaxID=34504 RepID=A0A5J4NEL2_9TREM|nr:ADP-ribosyl cyclase 1 [Paragonimus westermani]